MGLVKEHMYSLLCAATYRDGVMKATMPAHVWKFRDPDLIDALKSEVRASIQGWQELDQYRITYKKNKTT
jgi:hypothetical protein